MDIKYVRAWQGGRLSKGELPALLCPRCQELLVAEWHGVDLLAPFRTLPGRGAARAGRRLRAWANSREEPACGHTFHIIPNVCPHPDFSLKRIIVKTIWRHSRKFYRKKLITYDLSILAQWCYFFLSNFSCLSKNIHILYHWSYSDLFYILHVI